MKISIASIKPALFQRVRTPQMVQSMAESLAANGQLQPIRVRKLAPESYRAICGMTRLMGGISLGWTEIEAEIAPEPMTELDEIIQTLTENIRREGFVQYEKTAAIIAVQKAAEAEGKTLSAIEAGKRIGMCASEVSKAMQVSKNLIEGARTLMMQGKLKPSNAYLYSTCSKETQLEYLPHVSLMTRDQIIALKVKQVKPKPMTVKLDGGELVMPGSWQWEAILNWLRKANELAQKLHKNGTPPDLFNRFAN